jgi:hypothetical protein
MARVLAAPLMPVPKCSGFAGPLLMLQAKGTDILKLCSGIVLEAASRDVARSWGVLSL